MRNSMPADFALRTQAALTFGALTDVGVNELLVPFYVGLDFDARRTRFGGAVSDDSVRTHCSGLDLGRAIILGCWAPALLFAAIEIHPLDDFWKVAELCVTDRAETNRTTIIGHLLQLAAFAAGKRGCDAFMIHGPSTELVELLRGMGRVRRHTEQVAVDIGEYAKALQSSGACP